MYKMKVFVIYILTILALSSEALPIKCLYNSMYKNCISKCNFSKLSNCDYCYQFC